MSGIDLEERKRELRLVLRTRLRKLSPAEREEAGEMVARHLVTHPLVVPRRRGGGRVRPVAFFSSLPFEISTFPLDRHLKSARTPRALPALEGDALIFRIVPDNVRMEELDLDALGIPTPPPDFRAVDPARCRVILTPGLAFDGDGGRLGQGGGHYDRLLARLRNEEAPPPVLGVGFDFQRIDHVPMGSLDQRLDGVCTPGAGVQLRPGPT
jgi:5-formyltetrahydrofolate cyclo-ligase